LQITPTSGPAFTATVQFAINPANLGQFKPGQQLTAKYESGNPSHAVIATSP
jgi:hypothetical protein